MENKVADERSQPCDAQVHTTETQQHVEVNGKLNDTEAGNVYNRETWDHVANYWDEVQSEGGNDMFMQLVIPQLKQLACCKADQTVLELGSGTGIICRVFARLGARVVGLDYSERMLKLAEKHDQVENQARSEDGLHPLPIKYRLVDLMNFEDMDRRAAQLKEEYQGGFDIITISMTIKSLPEIEPLAKALPLFLKPGGRVIVVDLHPVFSKPAGHREIQIYEDPATGKQVMETCIKIKQYLNLPPVMSEAVRGQNKPVMLYHRPISTLFNIFAKAGFVPNCIREPAFSTKGGDPVHAQSYHNFPQTPMLMAFRLKYIPEQIDGEDENI
ncbi:hypothetical protein M433DRAFT_77093 [Acidomyces richmondensis BFW]|nr:hypothetical protein M433DRAFT_77093 [Acidomyces richmondensis BFW]